MSVRVLTASAPLPEQRRQSFEVAATITIADIVAMALPGASDEALDRVRVAMVSGEQVAIVPRAWWGRVRPHPGTVVIVRVVPGAAAVATTVANALIGAGGSALAFNVVYAAAYVAASAAGAFALNALVQALTPPGPEPGDPETEYAIQGWQNEARPGDAVPLPFGRIRTAPLFAALPYTEIVNGEQYIRSLFVFGYGRLDISELSIGEAPIDDFDDVYYELREGTDSDDPVTLYPGQVIEESVQIELEQDEPHVRSTIQNATRASVVFHFPVGLIRTGETSDSRYSTNVTLRIQQRQSGGAWQSVKEFSIRRKTFDPFFRQFSWSLPSRGRWEIEITLIYKKDDPQFTRNTVMLAAVQSVRPEYPLNIGVPLALAAVRIRATRQLNGTLDSLNAVVQRYVPDYDGTEWLIGLSRNPASLYAYALQGPHNPYPVADAGIDWDQLADWHDFCADKGLHYDRDERRFKSLRELLMAICAAGRASPRHDGAKWGVVIDRSQGFAVDHISPRNASDFQGSRTYIDHPDAVRVRFRDETDGWNEAERIIPWPGHTGSIDITEQWDLPGKTNPDEIAREIYRRMQEAELRRDRWTVRQDGAARVATRGDRVLLSHDVLSSTQRAARVKRVTGKMIELDEVMTIEAGTSYAIRYVDFDAADTVGQSVLTAVTGMTGKTSALRVTGATVPPEGALVLFGVSGSETFAARVLEVEPGKDFSARLTLTNDAPEIDTLTDAYTPPAWDPAVGEVEATLGAPAVPVIGAISTQGDEGSFGTDARSVDVPVSAGAGSAVAVAEMVVQHRLSGAGSWTEITIPTTSGSAALSYDLGDAIEVRAAARSYDDTLSAFTSAVAFTVADDVALPGALDLDAQQVTGTVGHAILSLSHGDADASEIAVFRTPSGDTLDTATDLVRRVEVAAGATAVVIDGDSTRSTVLQNSSFGAATGWTEGGGWSISGGEASHTTGAASTLSQSYAFTSGETYRGQISVSGRTAGSITVQLAGGTTVAASAISADGGTLFSVDAVTGNDRIEIVASSDFDGAITNITLIRETAATAPQGAQDYRFAAVNTVGVGTAPTSAITRTII